MIPSTLCFNLTGDRDSIILCKKSYKHCHHLAWYYSNIYTHTNKKYHINLELNSNYSQYLWPHYTNTCSHYLFSASRIWSFKASLIQRHPEPWPVGSGGSKHYLSSSIIESPSLFCLLSFFFFFLHALGTHEAHLRRDTLHFTCTNVHKIHNVCHAEL